MLSLQQVSKRSANAEFTIKNFAYDARISMNIIFWHFAFSVNLIE